jgi:hypothetical protein
MIVGMLGRSAAQLGSGSKAPSGAALARVIALNRVERLAGGAATLGIAIVTTTMSTRPAAASMRAVRAGAVRSNGRARVAALLGPCGYWRTGARYSTAGARPPRSATSSVPSPRHTFDDFRTGASMPHVDVALSSGPPGEDELLHLFRRHHPRYKVVGLKVVVGVALLPLDDLADLADGEAYLATRRYARRRAERLGGSVALFDPVPRRSEVLAIHASLPKRQGRPIDADYLDADAIWETGPQIDHLGVFEDDVLLAQSCEHYGGEIAGLPPIMGHGDHLDNGVMFPPMAGIVDHTKSSRPGARHVMHDTFIGAPDGLRSFKTNLGFQPNYAGWERKPARLSLLAQP